MSANAGWGSPWSPPKNGLKKWGFLAWKTFMSSKKDPKYNRWPHN